MTDPRGGYPQLTPGAQGMLTRLEDPNRSGRDFVYDSDGLLDVDAAGGSQTLTRGVELTRFRGHLTT